MAASGASLGISQRLLKHLKETYLETIVWRGNVVIEGGDMSRYKVYHNNAHYRQELLRLKFVRKTNRGGLVQTKKFVEFMEFLKL